MKRLRSVLSVLLILTLVFSTSAVAYSAEKDVVPLGICVDEADDDITTIIRFHDGGTFALSGAVDLENTEENTVIESIGSYEVRYKDIPVLTVEPRDITATSASSPLPNGYYAVTFDIPNTTKECFLTGLLPEKVDAIRQKLLDAYAQDQAFHIEDIDFIDAEKLADVDGDNLLCWAATASNMLRYSGWGEKAGFDSEDDIFEAFIASYIDEGGIALEGIRWFFNGFNDSYNLKQPDSGKYLPDYDPGDLTEDHYLELTSTADGYAINELSQAVSDLKEGDAVGLSVDWLESEEGHAVTLWGCITDNAYQAPDTDHYCSLIISDSDNNEPSGTDRRVAPNTLDIYRLMLKEDDYGAQKLCIYYDDTSYGALHSFTSLKPYSSAIPHETDERATRDYYNDPDFKPVKIRTSSYPEAPNEAITTLYEGDVYLYADLTNAGKAVFDQPMAVDVTVTGADGSVVYDDRISIVYTSWHMMGNAVFLTKLNSLSAGEYTVKLHINPDVSFPESRLFNNVISSSFTVEGTAPDTSGISLTAEMGSLSGRALNVHLNYGDLEKAPLYQNSDKIELKYATNNGDIWYAYQVYPSMSTDAALPDTVQMYSPAQKVRFVLCFYENGKESRVYSDIYDLPIPYAPITPSADNPRDVIRISSLSTGFENGEQLSFSLSNRSSEEVPALEGTIDIYAQSNRTGEIVQLLEPQHLTLERGAEPSSYTLSTWKETEMYGYYQVFARFTCDDYDRLTFFTPIGSIAARERESAVVTTNEDIVSDYDCVTSLREAVQYCGEHGGSVTFGDGMRMVTLNAPINIDKTIRIDGSTTDDNGNNCCIKVSGAMTTGLFTIEKDGSLALQNLYLSDSSSQDDGGAILCNGGTLMMNHCFIYNCNTEQKGVIAMNGGKGVLHDTSFRYGYANYGSVVYMDNEADMELLNVAAYMTFPKKNGVIYNKSGRLNLINSTIIGHSFSQKEDNQAIVYSEGDTAIINSIITDNDPVPYSASGNCRVYGSALQSKTDEVIADDKTAFYENGTIVQCDSFETPKVKANSTTARMAPLLNADALQGYYVSEQDGILCLSKDDEHFETIGIQTDFSAAELALDSVGSQRRSIYGSYSRLASEIILGDADLNDIVDVTDATLILRYDVQMVSLSDIAQKSADVDSDGEATVLDATWIQRYNAKMKVKYPIGVMLSAL